MYVWMYVKMYIQTYLIDSMVFFVLKFRQRACIKFESFYHDNMILKTDRSLGYVPSCFSKGVYAD